MAKATRQSSIHNKGLARLCVQSKDGISIAVDQQDQTPLQLHRPLYLEGASFPTIYIKTPSSGLLGGDEHEVDVIVREGAQLELRTQAATLVYPGRSTLQMNFIVEDNARLDFLPHPIILGAQSSLTQTVCIKLGKNAILNFADTWCAGRVGMKELWEFDDYKYQLEIFQENILTYRESWEIIPHKSTLTHPLLSGEFTHFASVYQFGVAEKLETSLTASDFTEFQPKVFETEKRWLLSKKNNHIQRRAYRVNNLFLPG